MFGLVGLGVLAGAAALAYAAYPTNGVTTYTGCLQTSGTGAGSISKVKADPVHPLQACTAQQGLIHFAGGTITQVTPGTGVTLAGSGGTGSGGSVNNGYVTVGLKGSYRLPQTCSFGDLVSSFGTTWVCKKATSFAASGQTCPPHEFANGINNNGTLTCAQPSIADLAGSPCTYQGLPSVLLVNTDPNTGAVSMQCDAAYHVSISFTGGVLDGILIKDYDGSSKSCSSSSTCSAIVPAGHALEIDMVSGNANTGGGSPFSYTCPANSDYPGGPFVATQDPGATSGFYYVGECQAKFSGLSGDFAVTGSF